MACDFYFAEGAKKTTAFVAQSNGAFGDVFEAGSFAFGRDQALRINRGGGAEQRWEKNDAQMGTASGAGTFAVWLTKETFGKSAVAAGQKISTGALVANHSGIAEMVVQRTFLVVEGGHEIANAQDHAAELLSEIAADGATHANGATGSGYDFQA